MIRAALVLALLGAASAAHAGCTAPAALCDEAPFEVRETAFDKRWIYLLSAPRIQRGEKHYSGLAFGPRGEALTGADAGKTVVGIAKRRRCTLTRAEATTGKGTAFRLTCPN